VDIKKAFDTVNRPILLEKLENFNADSSWFCAYLTPIYQLVYNNNEHSNETTTIRGLVQGGCLSGILFALYINDLPDAIQFAEPTLYADETQLLKTIHRDSIEEDLNQLQQDCNNISEWMIDNDLLLNPDITEHIIHSNRKDYKIFKTSKILMDNSVIHCSSTIKSLGLTKDTFLEWGPHIKRTKSNSYGSLNKIRAIRNMISEKVAETLTESFVLTQIHYLIPIWGKCSKKNFKTNTESF